MLHNKEQKYQSAPVTFYKNTNENLLNEQKKVFSKSFGEKIKYFLCPHASEWQSLLAGEGKYWQKVLLKLDEFKIEHAEDPYTNRSSKLYKSGNLLYQYGGSGKGSYFADVYLIVPEEKSVKLEKFFSIDCGRYTLPDDLELLPFAATSDDPCATSVSSPIRKTSKLLYPIANQIESLIWDISLGKPIDPKELTEAVNTFENEVKNAFEQLGSKFNQTIIHYNETILTNNVAKLPIVTASSLKKLLFPTKFFKEGFDKEKRDEINNIINTFIKDARGTEDFHIFQDNHSSRPDLTLATNHQDDLLNHLEELARKFGVICGPHSYCGQDGHPKSHRCSFTCYETTEDIESFRQFLDEIRGELNQNLTKTVSKAMR